MAGCRCLEVAELPILFANEVATDSPGAVDVRVVVYLPPKPRKGPAGGRGGGLARRTLRVACDEECGAPSTSARQRAA